MVNGSSSSAPSLHEAVEALLSDDEGHLLFSVAGTGPEEDGGVPLDTTQARARALARGGPLGGGREGGGPGG